jgi:hypothetical protein
MPFLEGRAFCELSEYELGRPRRLRTPDQFQVGDLHTLMLRLGGDGAEAGKVTTRLHQCTAASGILAVRFAILNDKLEEESTINEKLMGGYINRATKLSIVNPGNPAKPLEVQQAYFKDYFSDVHDFILAESSKLTTSV